MFQPQDSLPLCPEAFNIAKDASLTHEFYQFTQYKQQLRREHYAFEQYRRWYHQSAADVQHDLARMQHDINILGWFCHTRSGA